MALSRLQVMLGFGIAGIAAVLVGTFYRGESDRLKPHQSGELHHREVVREVARAFEVMAREGKSFSVSQSARIDVAHSVASPGGEIAVWSSFATGQGFSAFQSELEHYGDSSQESVATQRLLVLDHFSDRELSEAGQHFAQEAFADLQKRPEEALRAVSRLLDSLPLERPDERSYLIQLTSRLTGPGSPTHAQVVSLLHQEMSREGVQEASPGKPSCATTAAIELINMGEIIPEASELAKKDPILALVLNRNSNVAGERAPSAETPPSYEPQVGSGPGSDESSISAH